MPLLSPSSHPPSPLLRFAASIGAIALAETGVMVVLHRVLPEATTPLWLHIAADTASLVLLVIPGLWWLLVRPLGAALAETRRQAQTLLDTAAEAIVSMDENGRILSVNRAAETIFGYAAHEILGREVACLLPEAQAARLAAPMRAARESAAVASESERHVTQGRRKDGTLFPLELAVAEAIIGGQRIFIGVIHDVRAHKETEAALARTTALLERILATIPAPVAYLDREFNFIRVNDAYARADDREPAFFVGKNHFALYPDAENEAIFRRVVETGQPFAVQAKPFVYPQHPERGVTYWDVRIDPLLDENGRVENLLLTLNDVTAHKRLELALEESQENARALLDAIGESAMLLSPDGIVLAINRTGAERLGQTPEAMVGHGLREFLPPELAASREAHLAAAVRTGLPVRFEDSRAGRRYQVTINPIAGGQGQVSRVAAYAHDVTETWRLQATETLLREADEHILRGTAPEQIMTFICDRVARTFGFAVVWFARKEKDGSVSLVAAAGPATGFREEAMRIGVRWDDSPAGHGPTGSAIRLGRPRVMRTDEPDFTVWHEAARRHGLGSAASLPLVLRGEIYGAFTVYSDQVEAFSEPQAMRTLENIASHAAVALEASFEHEQRRLLSTALATAANAVFITDRDGTILWVNEAFSRLCGHSPAELVGRTPRLLKSGVHDAAYYDHLWSTIAAGQPWTSQTTERHKDGHLYTVRQTITPVKDSQGRVTHFIAVHEDISDALAAQARMEHMAHFDALTGLPNRSLFFDRLGQALALSRRTGERLALLFLDLDRFKPVNDTWGHAVGDALLKQVAARLSACVRESDTVARIAGDEFTVILTGLASREDAGRVAEKIIRAMGEPFEVDGHMLQIGVSIGIALYPDDAVDGEELMRRADDAMYAAKEASRNTYRFYAGT